MRFDHVELAEVVEQLAEVWNKRVLVLRGVQGPITADFQEEAVSSAIKRAVKLGGPVTCRMICDTVMLYPAGAELRLGSIEVDGNERTLTDTVLRNMRSKPGEPFDPQPVQKDMARLLTLGFFSRLDLELEQGLSQTEVALIIHVVEQRSGLCTIGGHGLGPERWPDAVRFNAQP